jgi:hypothetical protein
MSTTTQYLDRLKNIRDKYTQNQLINPTNTTPSHNHHPSYDRNHLKNYLKPEPHTIEKNKHLENPTPNQIPPSNKYPNYSHKIQTPLPKNHQYPPTTPYQNNHPKNP